MSTLSGASEYEAITDWKDIRSNTFTKQTASLFGVGVDGKCPVMPTKAFILNAHNGTLETTSPKTSNDPASTPYAQVVYGVGNDPNAVSLTYGIWVEAVRADATQNYTDFHIRACWYGPTSGPAMTLGTIVRLYAPTN